MTGFAKIKKLDTSLKNIFIRLKSTKIFLIIYSNYIFYYNKLS